MATVIKQQYTAAIPADAVRITSKGKPAVRFTGEDGKPEIAPLTKCGTRCRRKSSKWYGQYTDADGKKCRKPLSENKDAAKKMLADIRRQVEAERAGYSDPTNGNARKPMAVHVADWLATLDGTVSPDRVKLLKARVEAVMSGCGFVFPRDLSAESLERHLTRLRTGPKGKKVQTTNDMLGHVKQLCNWMVNNNRLQRNPFVTVKKLKAQADRARINLVPDVDQVRLLVAHTEATAAVFRRLTGRDRAMLYRVAALTGYRANELAELVPVCFVLDTDPPTIGQSARYTRTATGPSNPSLPTWRPTSGGS